MSETTYQQINIGIRVKEYENGEPFLLVEQKAPPNGGAADDLKPFAFDLKPGTSCAEADALAQSMRCLVTHVHFE